MGVQSFTKRDIRSWFYHSVDMPGMGPGADIAGWWVNYIHELMQLGKYKEALHYLTIASRTGALEIIIEAQREQMKESVQERRKQKEAKQRISGTYTLDGTSTSYKKSSIRPGVKKILREGPTEWKSEPYFHRDECG